MSDILIKYIQKKSEEGDKEAKQVLTNYYEILLKKFSSEVHDSKPNIRQEVNVIKTQQYNCDPNDDIHQDIRY